MKEINQTTFLDLAGKAAYQRGETYYRDGRVSDLRINGNSIIAEVEGTELYRVNLKHTVRVFEGSCDCPASENFDFCKHCVATSLKYLEQCQSKEVLKESKGEDLLKNYLLSLDKKVLAEQLEILISNDKILEDDWNLKAEIAAGKLDHKAFKKRFTKAIPYNRHLYRYAQVRDYFARIELVVDKLAEFRSDFKAVDVMGLVDYALQRIEKALETVDDSGGFRYASVEMLNELHIDILNEIDWPAEKRAAYLLEIYNASDNDFYPDIPGSYVEALGEEGLKFFNAELQIQWDALPPVADKKTSEYDWETGSLYRHLQGPLLVAATLRGDIDCLIQLKEKTAVNSRDCIEISTLCLGHDRLAEAIDWWQKAISWQKSERGYRGDRNETFSEQEVAILSYQKKYTEALQIRWAEYQQIPNLHSYGKLVEMAALAKDASNWYDRAVDYLNAKFEQKPNPYLVSLIAELHLKEQHPEQALALAKHHQLHSQTLLEIIRANKEKVIDIIPIYLRVAESEVDLTKNSAYRSAIKLLKEVEKLTINDEQLHKIWFQGLEQLHVKFKVKRNFKGWLEEAFPELD